MLCRKENIIKDLDALPGIMKAHPEYSEEEIFNTCPGQCSGIDEAAALLSAIAVIKANPDALQLLQKGNHG